MQFLKTILVFFGLLLINKAIAQLHITGKVVNDKNEPVQGATVTLTEKIGVSTNVDGGFSIAATPGMKYVLQVTAVGYESRSMPDVEAGKMSEELIIVLAIASKVQETVIVRTTSRRQESTSALINFHKNNTALSSGLAADFIRRTPDRNTGEVLKRVSGASIQDN